MPVFLCPACGKTLFSGDRLPSHRLICAACGAVTNPPIDIGEVLEPGTAWSAASQWSVSTTPAAAAVLAREAANSRRTTARRVTPTSAAEPWPVRVKWMSVGAAAVGLPLLMVLAFVISQNRPAAIEPMKVAQIGHRSFLTTGATGGTPTTQVVSTQQSTDGAIADGDRSRAATQIAVAAQVDPSKTASIVKRPTTGQAVDPPTIAAATTQKGSGRVENGNIGNKSDGPRKGPEKDPPAVAKGSETKPAATKPAEVVASRPPLQPAPLPRAGGVADEEIEESIRAGIEYLASQFDGERKVLRGSFRDKTARGCGANALSVYALLQAGLAVNDARLNPRGELGKALLEGVKTLPNVGGPETYATSLRAAALALFNRPEDRAALERDVQSLVQGQVRGEYNYITAHPVGSSTATIDPDSPQTFKFNSTPGWDNSNSQYGVLGVWAGADVGAGSVTQPYWEAIESHWLRTQCRNGQWSYGAPTNGGTMSMTAAGLATLFVIRDFLSDATGEASVGRPPFGPALQNGLSWWERQDNAINIPESPNWGYTMYGVERVGLASGFKYFGKNDWFRILARRAIGRQEVNGSWANNPIETSYALLFLSRGRHPVMMNKLRFEGSWANRPRDTANLARHVSRELERPLNWQVVDLKHPWEEWLDAPILSIASHKAPKFNDSDIDKFRRYALAGGMLFTHTDAAAKPFEEFVEVFAKRLFPQYKLEVLPETHPLFSAAVKMKSPPVHLKAVQNGGRILLLHSSTDVAETWQLHRDDRTDEAFQFGLNLFVYTSGRRELRNRLDSPYIAEPPAKAPLGVTKVARLQYAGDWDPDPWAWTRYSRLFQFRTGMGMNVSKVKWKDLSLNDAPLVHLTGAAAYHPAEDEVAALKAYIEAGGVAVIDDLGGGGAFAKSMREMLLQAFGPNSLQLLFDKHPLARQTGPGMADITKPVVRIFAKEKGVKPALPQLLKAGKGHVIFCTLDVTSGLLGTNTWGIVGYEPRYAQSILQNAIFWTIDGQSDIPVAAPPTTGP